MLSNGSRKYKLNKELFGLRQNKQKITEYYTVLSSLWEEIDSMNVLPSVTTAAEDITVLMKAIETQKAESKLFQFLNGLDDVYTPLRSQLLMQHPLPSVDMAYATIQQEEAHRDVLNTAMDDLDVSAMYSKAPADGNVRSVSCNACGGKGHSREKCWTVVGYPKWHHKSKKPVGRSKWQGNRGENSRMVNAAVVQGQSDCEDQTNVMFTSKQVEHLLKFLPSSALQSIKGPADSDEEPEHHFSGMVTCHMSMKEGDS